MSASNVVIRTCAEADLEAVLRLRQAWAEEAITYGYVPVTYDSLVSLLGPYFLVAEANGAPVGFAYGTLTPGAANPGMAALLAGEPYLNVEELYVDRRYRDGGIGGRLLDQRTATARATGVSRCLVYSASKDLDSILRFYRAHEFAGWSVQLFREG